MTNFPVNFGTTSDAKQFWKDTRFVVSELFKFLLLLHNILRNLLLKYGHVSYLSIRQKNHDFEV